jgi:hypothetical protein
VKHIDEFIDFGMGLDFDSSDAEVYARWFFALHRFPAILLNRFARFIERYKLFCTWEGERWRVTGASRMGDVWLRSDFTKDHGYDKRVDVAECSAWGAAADPAAAELDLDLAKLDALHAALTERDGLRGFSTSKENAKCFVELINAYPALSGRIRELERNGE